MNQQTANPDASNFKGEIFLFSRPELLNVRDHGGLGLNAPKHPFAFAKSAKFVPIAATEIVSAQKHYPIVFSSLKQPTLLAILSVPDSDNLFVEKRSIGIFRNAVCSAVDHDRELVVFARCD